MSTKFHAIDLPQEVIPFRIQAGCAGKSIYLRTPGCCLEYEMELSEDAVT